MIDKQTIHNIIKPVVDQLINDNIIKEIICLDPNTHKIIWNLATSNDVDLYRHSLRVKCKNILNQIKEIIEDIDFTVDDVEVIIYKQIYYLQYKTFDERYIDILSYSIPDDKSIIMQFNTEDLKL